MSFMALLFAGCSTGEYDEPDTRVPKVQEPEVSYTRGFYYKGNITLFKANTDEKIYSISTRVRDKEHHKKVESAA